MMTIMLFTVLLAVSDARVNEHHVRTHLNKILNAWRVGDHGYHPKTASIILRGSKDEYLLFQETSEMFCYPGGKVDYPGNGHNHHDVRDVGAALREFREETGFPLEEMIAESANRRDRDLADLVSGRRVTPTTDEHQVFLVNVDCPLFDMLTLFGEDGAMCGDKRKPRGNCYEQIRKAGWRTYKVGALAKNDAQEGDRVALATLKQIEAAHADGGILRGAREGSDGPYLRILRKAAKY